MAPGTRFFSINHLMYHTGGCTGSLGYAEPRTHTYPCARASRSCLGHATPPGGRKSFGLFADTDRFLGLLQIAEKVGIRVTQNGSIHQVMVADLVSASLEKGIQNRQDAPKRILPDESGISRPPLLLAAGRLDALVSQLARTQYRFFNHCVTLNRRMKGGDRTSFISSQ
jgi:hypothetical protein